MAEEKIEGRSVFSVDIVPQGIQVKTLFLTNDDKLLDAPAIFPNVEYATQQMEELKAIVLQKFAEAPKAKVRPRSNASNVIDLFKK